MSEPVRPPGCICRVYAAITITIGCHLHDPFLRDEPRPFFVGLSQFVEQTTVPWQLGQRDAEPGDPIVWDDPISLEPMTPERRAAINAWYRGVRDRLDPG